MPTSRRATGVRSRVDATRSKLPNRFHWGWVLRNLDKFYGAGAWRRPLLRERGSDPYRVLVTTLLSHRSRDEATALAWDRLRPSCPSVRSLARADPLEVERLIRGVGLSDSKSRALVRVAKQVETRFGGTIPRSTSQLRSLSMVGPKTASAIQVFAFGIPALPVDSHIHRVANRLGVVSTRTPEATARELAKVVPRRYWAGINPGLVLHGKNLCRRSRPLCGPCPIRSACRAGRRSAMDGRQSEGV
jgi:endonuclease-3